MYVSIQSDTVIATTPADGPKIDIFHATTCDGMTDVIRHMLFHSISQRPADDSLEFSCEWLAQLVATVEIDQTLPYFSFVPRIELGIPKEHGGYLENYRRSLKVSPRRVTPRNAMEMYVYIMYIDELTTGSMSAVCMKLLRKLQPSR